MGSSPNGRPSRTASPWASMNAGFWDGGRGPPEEGRGPVRGSRSRVGAYRSAAPAAVSVPPHHCYAGGDSVIDVGLGTQYLVG